MSDDTENGGEKAVELLRVPGSATEFLTPNPSSLITEAANFLRAHWDDVRHFYAAISGEAPSIHGSVTYDEAACVFAIQDIASKNGFAFLGSVKATELRKALRFGFKRNTGLAMWQLEAQNRRLRLEHKTASATAPKTDPDVTE